LLDIETVLDDLKPDVLFVCEHWLTNDDAIYLRVSGYSVANIFCRSNFKNGGTAILLKDGLVPINLPAAPSHLLSEKNFE
jgi:hypothetical protein